MSETEQASVVPVAYLDEPPIIGPGHTIKSIGEKISDIVLTPKIRPGWVFGLLITSSLTALLFYTIGYLVTTGIGIWGNNIPVAWAFDIVNFVWWIGIGHAGTLISAILLLLNQQWRTSINRFAEAMTIFAVMCAGLFPALHTGRPWLDYWLFPYPNSMNVWPQFRSPLIWDVFAVSTYATISLVFWFIGLVPDLATLRDKATSKTVKKIYGLAALGWRGSAKHWNRYETAYLLLAGLSTPLVLSVHTVVSFDFAAGIVPGWHTTIFPPYFVAGAIYSGFAMVLSLAIPIRKFFHLEDMLTMRHLDNMAKVMLGTGLIVAYGYVMEVFFGLVIPANETEHFLMMNRMFGPYGFFYWMLILFNIALPQLLWLRKVRSSIWMLFVLSIIVNIGMWLERFVIIVSSLNRDFVTSSWGMYTPTFWDFAMFFGTIGLFLTLFLLFIRFLPMISIAEMKMLLPVVNKAAAKAKAAKERSVTSQV